MQKFIVSKGDKTDLQRLKKAFNKYNGKPDLDKKLTDKFNKKDENLLSISSGKWMQGENPDLDKIDWTTGIHESTFEGIPCLVEIDKLIKPESLPFSAVRNEMVTGYQNQLEEDWIIQLKSKYPVKINSIVLEEIRKMVTNE